MNFILKFINLTSENIKRLSNCVSNETRLQDFTAYINPEICDYPITDLCDVRRVLILTATRSFLLRSSRMSQLLFMWLQNACTPSRGKFLYNMSRMSSWDLFEVVLTASREIEQHSNFKVSKFYNNLLVLCSNLGCNQYTSYFLLTQYEIFQCPQRYIFCSAESCPYVGDRESSITHN